MRSVDPPDRRDAEALAVRAAAGDVDALSSLYELFADDVRRVALLAVGGDYDIARDVSGRTWLRVGEHIRQYRRREGAGFTSWLFTITRNAARDHHRSAYTRREVLTADMLQLDHADPGLGPEGAALHTEQAQQVAEAMRKLTPKQRKCLLLRYWHNLSTVEAASLMGCTPNTFGVLQHRAMTALRRHLPPGASDAGPTRTTPQQRASAAAPRRAAAGEAAR